jgi:hypothetical protein
MPVGTIIEEADGTRYTKTAESRREPFPWTAVVGEFGDERMVHLLDDGAQVVEP